MNKPVLLLGAGGHAKVLVDILRQLNVPIVGMVAATEPTDCVVLVDIPYFANDTDVLSFKNDEILLVNAIGSLPGKDLRFKLHQYYKQSGYQFMTVISPQALVSQYASVAEGVQIMPGCIVNAGTSIGEGSIINSGAIVEHDCHIGRHNHIAPGSVLSGGVKTGDYVHIGTGAKVIQGIQVGEHTMVGAGATVTKNLDSNKKLYVAKPFLV